MMATSKFFTWTKGDRKHVSAGVISLPAESLSFAGMDPKPTKYKHKPLPLDFSQSLSARSSLESSVDEHLTIHKAAVQSATSLIAVMSDVLRSPQFNAHLQSNHHSEGLRPHHGRPRSRTAPPTPLVEASFPDPVELPVREPFPSGRTRRDAATENGTSEESDDGPHISVPKLANKDQIYHRQSCDVVSRKSSHLRPPVDDFPRARPSGSRGRESARAKTPRGSRCTSNTSERPGTDLGSEASEDGRPCTTPPYVEETPPHIRPDSSRSITRTGAHLDCAESSLDQMTALRAAHEAHISYLKEAHEREIVSHRVYIAFLESERVQSRRSCPTRQLTVHTRPAGKHRDAVGGGSDAMLPALSSSNQQECVDIEATAETKGSRYVLDSARNAQVEPGGTLRTSDEFWSSGSLGDQRINDLEETVRKGRENEKALRETIQSLEAALEIANMERIDVQEGFHEACKEIRNLRTREQEISQELARLKTVAATRPKQTLATMGKESTANPSAKTPIRHTGDFSGLREKERGGLLARNAGRIRALEEANAGMNQKVRLAEDEAERAVRELEMAKARIVALEAVNVRRPETPESRRGSSSSGRSSPRQSTEMMRGTGLPFPGLGGRAGRASPPRWLPLPTGKLVRARASNPVPMRIQKELPELPLKAGAGAIDEEGGRRRQRRRRRGDGVQRQETTRSLSDSIISTYARM